MLRGLFCDHEGLAEEICGAAFERGLIMETSGSLADVIKVMPPLTIDEPTLGEGLDILRESFEDVVRKRNLAPELEAVAVGG
ncbi:MAG: diaminobutyrate--2-oxoglutarate transaminase, partial [Dehalococcoidia bacterium]